MKVIHIIERIDGDPLYRNTYIYKYDPTQHRPDGTYDGGLLQVVSDPRQAKQYTDIEAAIAEWQRTPECPCHGTRLWDGKPNRPLTGFTIEVEDAPEPER